MFANGEIEMRKYEKKEVDYQLLYYTLFNVVTDALDELEKGDAARAEYLLREGQLETEDIFIKSLE